MQVGGRWPVGGTPPRGLPASFVAALAAAEVDASEAERRGSWTLTWLEGRPVAELDSGRRVSDAALPHGAAGADDEDDDLFPDT